MSISEGKLSMNQFDTIRAMWEDSLNEKKEIPQSEIVKLEKMTDRNDHNGSVLHLAKIMNEKSAKKMMELLSQMHKVEGHMTTDMVNIRKGLLDAMLSKAKSQYSNYDEIYKSF